MENRNIIVIGASAGGMDAIKELIAHLPADFNAAIFIVWHIPPTARGVLPLLLNKLAALPAANAIDEEPIKTQRVYVAPPDRHLLLEKDRVRLSKGPRENGSRPAADPLFRSAAYTFGPRVIGIVLSGGLDDGTAGLWAIKQQGGITIVQDPAQALTPSMPESARRQVAVDYVLPVAEMAPLLVRLVQEKIEDDAWPATPAVRIEKELQLTLQQLPLEEVMRLGELTPYTCPECHGVLMALRDGEHLRFRCHTGHAFSADSLLEQLTGNIEKSLWNTVRGVEESILLLNHMGDHFAEVNQPLLAARYFKKAREARERVQLVRQAIELSERIFADSLEEGKFYNPPAEQQKRTG